LILVVAVDPSFFNNNQPTAGATSFWCLRLGGVAGWLWRFLQAEQQKKGATEKGAKTGNRMCGENSKWEFPPIFAVDVYD
jgi:hypothetical protein